MTRCSAAGTPALADAYALRATGGAADVDYDQFCRLLQAHDPVKQWATELGLGDMLADALTHGCVLGAASTPSGEDGNSGGGPDSHDMLRAVAQLSREQVLQSVEALAAGLRRSVTAAVDELRASLEHLDQMAAKQAEDAAGGAAAKFQVVTMASGKVDDFHAGLDERIGEPRGGGEKR